MKELFWLYNLQFRTKFLQENSPFDETVFLFFQSWLQNIDKEIHPFGHQWEEKQCFPAPLLFNILAKAGYLGINKPTSNR